MFRCVPLITERLRFNTETQYSRARANINVQMVSRVSAASSLGFGRKCNGSILCHDSRPKEKRSHQRSNANGDLMCVIERPKRQCQCL